MSLIRANALSLPLRDESVDLIVTSPPYFALRSYQDGGEHYSGQVGSEDTPRAFLEALWAVTAECVRVLKPSGSIWVNLGDKYAGSGGGNQSGVLAHRNPALGHVHDHRVNGHQSPRRYNQATVGGARPKSLMGLPWRYALGCIDQLGLILRAEVIWSKPNGLPESVTDRVRRSHEQWFHFTREPRYYAAVDEIREPHIHEANGATFGGTKAVGAAQLVGSAANTYGYNTYDSLNPLGKLPGSVWSIPTEPLQVPEHLGVDHFAAFPQEWPRRLILGWSPPAICTGCNTGLQPTVNVDRSRVDTARTQRVMNGYAAGTGTTNHGTGGSTLANEADKIVRTITGYECDCDGTHPTRPAVILDPFCGTGTVPMVARILGRTGIGVDLSADYLKLADWRVHGSDHARKTLDRMGPTLQPVRPDLLVDDIPLPFGAAS